MIRSLYITLFSLFGFGASVNMAQATDLDLAAAPLYLGVSNAPNIMFTLDDSGSMHWEFMPDFHGGIYSFPRPNGQYGAGDYQNWVVNFNQDPLGGGNIWPALSNAEWRNFRHRSNFNNATFYNPNIDYLPWSNADGSARANANPRAAFYNPANPAVGTLDLTAQQTQVAGWRGPPGNFNGSRVYWPISYFIYNGPTNSPSNAVLNTFANYTPVRITAATPAGATFPYIDSDGNPASRTRNEEIQNFANWFQYYRSRILMARAGIGQAFGRQGGNMRVGFGAINSANSPVDGQNERTVINGLRSFSGANRTNFFNTLYGYTMVPNGTPLRRAVAGVGQYFQRTDNRGPWGKTPGSNDTTPHLSCRQSYHILMTDGFWNGGPPGVGNTDGAAGPLITGPDSASYQYTPIPPYADAQANTLADTAFRFWSRDLQPGLTNDVPTNPADEAFWQHLTTFTVGLGVNGNLDPADYPNLPSLGPFPPWGAIAPDTRSTIDDLWHAAVNTRGEFFSASNPRVFADKLGDILADIVGRESAVAPVALNSGSVVGGSVAYQSRFDSETWTGELLALPLSIVDDKLEIGAAIWNAATLIPAADSRTIITHDGITGQPFQYGNLSAGQQALVGNSDILDYLRGDQTNEPALRTRASLLGDLVHSAPQYVGKPELRYPEEWDNGLGPETKYSVFKAAKVGRTAQVYVGANDGMLHAFNAETGVETFAYVPGGVYNNLAELADPGYTHNYYADGTPSIIDAFIGGAWHTVLVSGLRGGGQSIFALDVTDPAAFSTEGSAKNKVLWEFTDDDMGYTFGRPTIARLHNGKWAAIFSGGYNNTEDNDGDAATGDSISGNAVLYIVDLATGDLLKKLDTKVGQAQDPTGQDRPNGLATPAVVDYDGDFIQDAIYVGDLFGSVWKIDISANTPSGWKFSYGSAANPKPIYTACADAICNATNRQPITSQIQVVEHPEFTGYLVLFGTGKYLEVGDNTAAGQITQTFYGLWDKAESTLTPFNRSDLLQQEITIEDVKGGFNVRKSTDHEISWDGAGAKSGWYMDLINTQAGNTDNKGERQVSNAVVRGNNILFVTILPSENACEVGGSSWIMQLDLASGSKPEKIPFDLNNDGEFNDDDGGWSGVQTGNGLNNGLSLIGDDDVSRQFVLSNDTNSGTVSSVAVNDDDRVTGRQSWRELEF